MYVYQTLEGTFESLIIHAPHQGRKQGAPQSFQQAMSREKINAKMKIV